MKQRNKEISDCYKKCREDFSKEFALCEAGEKGDECRENARNKYQECAGECDKKQDESSEKTRDCFDNCSKEHQKCLDEAGKN